MYTPLVRFRLPDGRLAAVQAGGIVGRLASATLRLDDPRVSEAHAMISLRGEDLHLLALRGVIEVDGKEVRQAALHTGSRVRLAEGVELLVESVDLPTEVLVVELSGGRTHPLHGDVMSIVDAQRPTIISRFDENALVRLWTSGIGWRGQARTGRPFDVRTGLEIEVLGVRVSFRMQSPATLALSNTSNVGLHAPLQVRTTLDELRITSVGRPLLRMGGLPAAIVRELADYAEPVPWEQVASAVLGPDDEIGLRSRWDRNLKTLRQKLEQAGLRTDLVRSDGHGKVSLSLHERDTIEVV